MGRLSITRGVITACVLVGTVAALPGPDVGAQQTRAGTVTVAVRNDSFESPRLTSATSRSTPSGARWKFTGTAGIARAASSLMSTVPAIPDGRQVAYLTNSGAVQQVVSVVPGDVLRFRASQIRFGRTGPQQFGVYVDTHLVGTVTPGDGTWSSHTVGLGIARRDVVTVEIRGLYAGEGQNRTAFLDAVSIRRPLASIPNTGLAKEERRAVVSSITTPVVSGVIGTTAPNDTAVDLDASVLAIAEWGDWIVVGGKFTEVARPPAGMDGSQRFLAAFDKNTGAWVPDFKPKLDGAVWDLATTPDGKLIVAGQFTNVNGQGRTAGLAAFDGTTKKLAAGWRASLLLTGCGPCDEPVARSLDVEGDWIYVGGNFTRIVEADGAEKNRARLAAVAVSDGRAKVGFAPEMQNGSVNGVDATSAGIVWVVGNFRSIGYGPDNARKSYPSVALAKIDVDTGNPVPTSGTFVATIDETKKQFAHTVLQVDGQVWVAGSQHMLQVYRASDLRLLRSWINFPIGDSQDLVEMDGIVYVGTHAGRKSRMFADARLWNSVSGATRVDISPWVNAVDADDRTHVTGWQADVLSANTEGAWAMFVDSSRCLWAGGDFNAGSPGPGGRQFARGFVRFCTGDTFAPSTPTNGRVAVADGGGRVVRWNRVVDSGPIRYEVFRDDRMIGTVTRLSFVDRAGRTGSRYFVRAVDGSGNRSATTVVLTAP